MQLPAFAHFYHMMPWDLERLEMAEVRTFSRDLAATLKRLKEEEERNARR